MPTTYAIPNGRTAMDATIYTGTGAPQTVTNAAGFKPDLLWIKSRSAAYYPTVYDSVRGTGNTKQLFTNTTDAEGAFSTITNLSSFNSNGFTVGTTSSSPNILAESGATFVAWQWNAGNGANVTNTTGTITSTVSANVTAGFSIVTYTGTGANATVGHGLGVAPSLVIVKARSQTGGYWRVQATALNSPGNTLFLNTTDTLTSAATIWNSTAPTSSVFKIVTDIYTNPNGSTYVGYCWAAVPGFSAFGTYVGNGSTDGPFLYLGFRPKYIMIKRTDGTPLDSWYILDSARSPYNVVQTWLTANAADAEASGSNFFDMLSNGFKIRASGGYENTSGANYIYAAFAENPLKYANAR